MEYLIVWGVCALLGYWMGDQKGQGGTGMLAGIILGPMGLVVILAARPSQHELERRAEAWQKANRAVAARAAEQS